MWRPRWPPLPARAVHASGAVARRLIARLLADDIDLASLSGVATPDRVVLLGSPEALPWVDGVGYLGASPAAPDLLLPTNLVPSAPEDLFQRALWLRQPDLVAPAAVWPTERVGAGGSHLLVVPLGGALRLNRAALEAWLEAAP